MPVPDPQPAPSSTGALEGLRGQPGAPPGVAGATGTPLPAPPRTGAPVTITLDGRQVRAYEGEVLIEAAERAGTYIPRFCYHPRMKPVGMCRMCLVDIKGPRGYSLSPACYVPVTDGLEAVTDSARVKKAQDGILEFLLVNHPLDCPVCDKGGECPLQDQTFAYGPGETRFVEEKRHWDKPIPISPLVLLDRERCIQCARCTRFAEEVAGDPAIDFFSRSDATEVAIAPHRPFSSNFSGNIVQICPVGALLAKPYRFRARPWDLEQVETTCTLCPVGCRVAAQSSANHVVRFLGVDCGPVNWGWLCDKGRFSHEALASPGRLAHPLVRRPAPGNGHRGEGELVEASWAEALSVVADRLAGVDGSRVAVIGGARLANEDAYAWAKFARSCLRTGNVDAQLGDGLAADLVASLPRATLGQAGQARLIVTLAGDLKEELPVLYLRLRHAVVDQGVPLVELSPGPTGLSSLAALRLHYRPGQLAALVEAIVGGSPVPPAAGEVGGAPAQDVERARAALAEATGEQAGTGPDGSPRVVVVLGRPSLAEPSSAVEDAARRLAQLPGVAFLPALRRANVHGAIDFGLAPGLLPGRVGWEQGCSWYERHWGAPLPTGRQLGTPGILEAAASGQLDVLVLLGADPLSDYPGPDLAARALDGARFVVALDALATRSTQRADVVLPVATYAERRGSFTNLEGRLSWLAQKVTPPGTARPDWAVAVELASRLGHDLGFGSLEGIWDEVQRVSPLHRGVPQALLASPPGRDGVVVPVRAGLGEPGGAASPPPLDPMANPGISQAEPEPAPPVAAPPTPGPAPAPAGGPDGYPPMLQPADLASPPPRVAGATPAPALGSLRLVTWRPMWDGGTLVQHSASLAGLHPPLAARAHPAQLEALGVPAGARVRVSSQWGSLELPAEAGPDVPPGTVVVPFNLPEGGAGELLDGAGEVVEVRVEALEAGR